MIDIENRNIVDMIHSREFEDVVNWLRAYPNLKLVSRDGSVTYSGAIKEAHPNSIQISDRFHLLKNLTDYCKKYITKTVSIKVKIGQSVNNEGEIKNPYITKSKNNRITQAKDLYTQGLTTHQISKSLKMDIRTVEKYVNLQIDESNFQDKDAPLKRHEESVSKKEQNIATVCKLYKEGYGIRAISRETGLARNTIKRYLDPEVSAVQGAYGTTRVSPLTPFHSIIDELILKSFTFKKIEDYIRNRGYTGSASAIRMYTTRKRRLENQALGTSTSKDELVERQHLIKLLYRPIEKVKEITLNKLEAVIEKYPILSQILELVKSFKEILFNKNPNNLDNWIEKAALLGIPELNSYIKGINRDIDGVKNSIIYDYSNGLAEGSVNKIKVIKRIMYGRCSFETLREKVLRLEKMRKFN